MDCRAFHETYTDLLDGLLEEADEVRFHEHLARCAACHRFDQAYRLGVSALQGLPSARSSRDFTARVLHAVRTDARDRVPSVASGFAGAALVAALIGFLAIDVKVSERWTSADVQDVAAAAVSPDSGADSVGLRLRDAALVPPFWDQRLLTPVRSVALTSNGPLFVVPAAWTGR